MNLHAHIVKVTAQVELRTDDGNVVGTTEVDLTPAPEAPKVGEPHLDVSYQGVLSRDVSEVLAAAPRQAAGPKPPF